MAKIEICANSYASASAAAKGGAYRIELCDNLGEGGTTPSYGMIKMVRNIPNLKLNVLIRPRAGDFLYSKDEFKIILEDIEMCKELGCDGIVIGFLQKDGTIDLDKMKKVIEISQIMEITFHRAIDLSADLLEATHQLKELGVDRILSSGGANKAIEGLPVLQKMISIAEKTTIIMPGSGIKSENISLIHNKLQAKEYHASVSKATQSKMIFRKNDIKMGSAITNEYKTFVSDVEQIKILTKLVSG